MTPARNLPAAGVIAPDASRKTFAPWPSFRRAAGTCPPARSAIRLRKDL